MMPEMPAVICPAGTVNVRSSVPVSAEAVDDTERKRMDPAYDAVTETVEATTLL